MGKGRPVSRMFPGWLLEKKQGIEVSLIVTPGVALFHLRDLVLIVSRVCARVVPITDSRGLERPT